MTAKASASQSPSSAGLRVTQLVKHFGGVKAVNGVSFSVAPGECVALIGPNGAGKSSCFACIAGQHPVTSGTVEWAGQALNGWPAAQRMRAGVARTFQVAQSFEALTVLQNLQLLRANALGLSAWTALKSVEIDDCMAGLAQVGLQAQAQAEVTDLPYGAKKRLELAMALAGIATPRGPVQTASSQPGASAVPAPRLLLLDEPAAGLSSTERHDLMRLVKSLCAQGIAVLYTEHNMDAVFGVADRVLVLIDGCIAAEGSPGEIAQNQTVQRRYLGQTLGRTLAGSIGQSSASNSHGANPGQPHA